MKRRKSYHHGDLRRALVDAAAELAAERGPESVTLREAAKRAGVSHAAPYHHFAGRGELLHAVALEGFRRMDAEMKAAYKRNEKASPYDRLGALGKAYIRFAARNPHYFRAMFRGVTLDKAFPDPDEHGKRQFEGLVQAVQACLGEAGPPSKRALDHVLTAWAIVHGTASLWVERSFCETPFENAKIDDLSRRVVETSRRIFAS